MKTIVKQLTVATLIAFLVTIGNVKTKATETKASGIENNETPLQLEKWMVDETIWNTNSANTEEFAQETEAKLELEDWMINETIWYVDNTEKEAGLTVEPWMLDESVWY